MHIFLGKIAQTLSVWMNSHVLPQIFGLRSGLWLWSQRLHIYIYKMWDVFIIELNLCNEGLLLKLCALVFRSQDLSTVQKQGGVSPETEACLGYVRFETSTWIHFSCTISAQVWSIWSLIVVTAPPPPLNPANKKNWIIISFYY